MNFTRPNGSVHTSSRHITRLMMSIPRSAGGNEWWLEVEFMSLDFCQLVWNPAQGNFRRSLCFGWLSSSRSPVTLWSCQAPCLLLHSLSILTGLMWEKTLSGLRQERPKYPIHLHCFPLRGLSNSCLSPFFKIQFKWQEVGKKTLLFFCQIPVKTSPTWGRHFWISHHTAGLSKCANLHSRFSHFRNDNNS